MLEIIYSLEMSGRKEDVRESFFVSVYFLEDRE
jgi:hypothetical protein